LKCRSRRPRITVTLDDLWILSASEQEFREVGWVPKDLPSRQLLGSVILRTRDDFKHDARFDRVADRQCWHTKFLGD
jgi:hypothetical protein